MAHSEVDGWVFAYNGTVNNEIYLTEQDAIDAADFQSTQTEALPYLTVYVIPAKQIIHTEE